MMRTRSGKTLVINGNYLDVEGNVSRGYIVVSDGRIQSIRNSPPKEISDDSLIVLNLDDDDIVFPGFLNLHTHIEYNTIPIWDSPNAPFNCRFEWRNDPGYKNDIKAVHCCITAQLVKDSKTNENDCTKNCINFLEKIASKDKNEQPHPLVYGITTEIQAISGGTTCIQEDQTLDYENPNQSPNILLRSTSSPKDFGFPPENRIFSVIDFYRPILSDHKWKPKEQDDLNTFDLNIKLKKNDQGKFVATLAHLAEGRSGFLEYQKGVDEYTRKEFQTFMSHIKSNNSKDIIPMHLSIIHGCGIDVFDSSHVDFLKEYGISVLWAPISNLLLYKDTLHISELLKKGVNVALGSDWSPSGGKHILEEAKFALWFAKEFDQEIKSYDIFKMITTNAAKCLGLENVGQIKPGNYGDFLIFTKPKSELNALDALLSPQSDDDAIKCVIVNGRILYGDKIIFDDHHIDYQPLPNEGNSAQKKGVSLNSDLDFKMDRDIPYIEYLLKNNIYRSWNRSHFLATDDKDYLSRLDKLKEDIHKKSIRVKKFHSL